MQSILYADWPMNGLLSPSLGDTHNLIALGLIADDRHEAIRDLVDRGDYGVRIDFQHLQSVRADFELNTLFFHLGQRILEFFYLCWVLAFMMGGVGREKFYRGTVKHHCRHWGIGQGFDGFVFVDILDRPYQQIGNLCRFLSVIEDRPDLLDVLQRICVIRRSCRDDSRSSRCSGIFRSAS